jgi:uncharacterized protein YcfJ
MGIALLFVGCASRGGYRPVVDTHDSPVAQNLTRDEAECRELAEQASRGTEKEAAKGALTGGAIGAATGAVIGAAAGSPGTGAAIGAAAGGAGGGLLKGLGAEKRFKEAFKQCMRNRGHKVLD